MEKNSVKTKPSENYGFPSHLLSPDKKGKEWCLKYIKAFHKEHTNAGGKILRSAFEQYEVWRAYANGRQPIDQYKQWMGVIASAGKKQISWKNLDWSILPIIPKFKKIIINKILSQPKKFKIKAIDKFSVNTERQQRDDISDWLVNHDFLNDVTKATGIQFESPIEQGAPVPKNEKELDLYIQMFPKSRMALELYDELELAFEVNNWEQLAREIVTNIVEIGVGGTRTYIDSNGYIKIRNVVPERTICNGVEKEDFSDLVRVGEFVPMTISDLRQMAPKGSFTEEQLIAIASKRSRKSYSFNQKFFDQGQPQSYDHEKIETLWAQWFSADQWAHVVSQDQSNQIHVDKKDNPFWLDKKGISDENYSKFYKDTKGEERYILRNELKNVYQGIWVVDTDIIFNYGLKTNMIRLQGSLADAKLDYNFYTLNFDSVMRELMPAADNAQLNWLQFQHHIANSRPDGIMIGKSAIGSVSIGGKAGLTLTPDDLIKMYNEKGSYVYKDVDANGKPLQSKPIERLQNGMSDAAERHFSLILQNIDLMRNILGVNELTDASTPNPEIGKAVAQQAMVSSNTALGDFFNAYGTIYENTGKCVAALIPDARRLGRNKGWIEALGEDSQRYWENNSDLSFLEAGLKLEDGWDEDQRKSIRDAAQASLKGVGGSLKPQDIYLIEQEENPDKAYMLIEAKTRQREEEEQNRSMELQKQNADVQLQAAKAAEEEKRKTLELELQAKARENQDSMELLTHEYTLKTIYLKVEKGLEMTAEEQNTWNDILRIRAKGAQDLAKAREMAKNKPKPVASKG